MALWTGNASPLVAIPTAGGFGRFGSRTKAVFEVAAQKTFEGALSSANAGLQGSLGIAMEITSI